MREASGFVAGVLRMSGDQDQSSRVLVVRDGQLRDRVSAAIEAARLGAQVEVSPSYLSAMGWLSRERVDVVIGPVSAMTGMVGSTARALRRLAPGTRLIVVANQDEHAEAAAAMTAGFDECVFEPADATALMTALRLPNVEPVEFEPEDDSDSESGASVSSAESAALMANDPQPTQQTEQSPTAANGAEPMGVDLLGLRSEQQGEIDPSGPVGDVDLAEAVIRGDGSMTSMAMRLLREQSGLTEAAYVSASDLSGQPVLDGAVEVKFGGRTYGWLLAQGSSRDQLLPWSAWLARWVALDAKQAELYRLAMRDELTGLWNRRYFDRFLNHLLQHAAQGRQQVTLLLFDIDNFKQYNDKYGHPIGDEVLRSTAQLIQSLVREHDVVARIGGDEFAVVFWDKGEPRHLGSQHPDNVIGIAKRFQKAICEHRFPKLGEEAVGSLTVSGGLAGFPWDGRTPEELVERADAISLQSKRQGKNAICFGQGAAPNGNGKS